MTRATATITLLLAATLPATSWDGVLRRPDGSPIRGARVSVVGHAATARSGDDGRVVLDDAPRPPLTLLVELPDGAVVAVELPALAPSGPTVIYVDPALHQEVDALARREIDLETSPGTVSRPLSTDEVARRGAPTVLSALESEPGTSVDVADRDAVPSLRGLARGRTLVLVDGAPLVAERRAGVAVSGAVPGTLAGIDVARGPNTILYGSSAMAGVVALRSPWADPGDAPRAAAWLEGRAGDAPSRAGSFAWSEDGWSLAAGMRDADDPEGADGSRLEGQARQQSVFAGHSRRVGTAGLVRIGVRFDRLSGADRLARADDRGRTTVPEDLVGRLVFRWDGPVGAAAGSLVAWTGTQRRETVLGAGDRAVPRLATTTRGRDAGVRFAITRDRGSRSLLAGFEATLRHGVEVRTAIAGGDPALAAALDPVPLAGGRQLGIAAFAVAGVPAGPASRLHVGLRAERIGTRAGGPSGPVSADRGVVSASLAWTRRLSDRSSLALQLASGFREPLLTERYMTGITGRGLVLAQPALAPERSRHADAVWRWAGRRLSVQAAAFGLRIEDVVEREFLEPAAVPPAFSGLPVDAYRFVNRGRARLDGLEVAARLRLSAATVLGLAAHRIRGTDGQGEPLGDLPADAVRADLETRRGPWRVGLFSILAARNDRPAGREVVTPGFAIVHLRVTRSLGGGGELGLIVRNALDRAIPAGPRADDPTAPGRTVGLFWRWSR
ncbi:MAG: hypothetical protein Kow0062_15990 [Acidobacteriota bacterium]